MKGEFNRVAIDQFNIHNDGWVVDTTASTDLSGDFIEDVLDWLRIEFGHGILDYPPLKKLYLNEVYVQFDIDLEAWLEPVRSLGQIITNATAKHYEKLGDYSLSGILMDYDTSELKDDAAGPFKLERKTKTPYDPGIYYSSSPLPTTEHLQVLEEIEALAKRK